MTKTRIALLIGVIAFEFVAIAGILTKVLPGPRREIDYLVIGTLATFFALGTLFLALRFTAGPPPRRLPKKEEPPKPEV